ncbi:MAG: hypothetical protein WKF47_06345 [Geodermatophilaceae bacterium]
MRVVVWGINYAPEFTGHCAAYSRALRISSDAHGHDVEMVTTFPYYPTWTKRPEDRATLYRTERINGVRVHRCWHFVPPRVSALKRILHEASFVFTSTLKVLTLRAAGCLRDRFAAVAARLGGMAGEQAEGRAVRFPCAGHAAGCRGRSRECCAQAGSSERSMRWSRSPTAARRASPESRKGCW